MGGLIDRIGPYRIEYLEPVFATLAKAIVHQQLSGKAALTIYNRLSAATSRVLKDGTDCSAPRGKLPVLSDSRCGQSGLSLPFQHPVRDAVTPESVLKLRPARMRSLGLSKQKIAYIRDLATQTRLGRVDFAAFEQLDDDAVIATLTLVKGIGVWTAHMFLIFALRRPDVLPVGDLGIRAAVRKVYDLAETPTPGEVEERGRCWRPYASVASWYLWRSLESKAGM
jgi:DNA-3-methyladenine glycosylase II